MEGEENKPIETIDEIAQPAAEVKEGEKPAISPEPQKEPEKDPETVPYTRFKEVYGEKKRLERDLDYWRNEASRKQAEPPKKPDSDTAEFAKPKPVPSDFVDYDQYVEALTDWKLEKAQTAEKVAKVKTERQEKATQFRAKLDKGFEKHPDFQEVVFNPNVPITEAVVQALSGCDNAADIVYYLGQNPKEANRIASLSPIDAGREIGKLEIKLSGPELAPQRTQTRAPEPTKPVGGTESPGKNWDKMTEKDTAEFIAHRNKQEFGA